VPGASVAAIAQEADINANLLFNWRRLYQRSVASVSVQESRDPVLLPVTVVEPTPTTATSLPTAPSARAPGGTIEINFRGTVVRVRGPVDEASLRTVLRALAGAA
jgi:transposase